MKKISALLFSILFLHLYAAAQDFPFGNLSEQELMMKKYAKDTAAHAVVLKEFGKSLISSADHFPLEHEYHVRIKLFDSKGFEQGNVSIPLYKESSESFEEVTDIHAVTYQINEKGSYTATELGKAQIFHEKKNKYYDVVKFAMPNLSKGCIIEYSYRFTSPFKFNYKSWDFQSDIPKIYSEYQVNIPAIYNYNISLRGPYKLTKTNAALDRECFSYAGAKADCSKLTYAMADVPAFIEEDYMTAPKNFLSAMYFELIDYTNISNGAKQNITKDWKDVDYTLKTNSYFGTQLKRKSLMRDYIMPVIAGKTDTLQKAKAIYRYIQKNIKWNNFYGKYSDDGIKSAMDKHTGNVGDINLALIAALSAADIKTEAVLLSTRSHGLVNRLFPVESDFDYVIAKANIGGKSYLLDATDPMLSFGLLPMHCINDQGRVMSLDKPSYWTDLTADQKSMKTDVVDLTLQNNGKLTGTLSHHSFGYEAYKKRLAIKKFNTADEYVENLDAKMPKIKITNYTITNLDTLDAPLSEVYTVEISAFDNLEHSRIAFNPYLIDKVSENPFKLAERNYPVDMGSTTDERMIMTLHLPENFVLEAVPQPVNLGMPNHGGKFITEYVNESNTVTFSQITQLSHTVYSSEEYPYLKEMFNKIIQAEKTDLIFRKKS
ncbi:DUF3857 domain-containing protein [Mucilaginibacter sp.]